LEIKYKDGAMIFRILMLITMLTIAFYSCKTRRTEGYNYKRVIDSVGLLSDKEEKDLQQKIFSLEEDLDLQIAIAFVDTLYNQPIKDYSIRMGNELGFAPETNRMLLVVSFKDRAARLEIDNDLVKRFPEKIQSEILTSSISANFSRGEYYGGFLEILTRIERHFHANL
jgi:uncharacterized membrane protein YgcG